MNGWVNSKHFDESTIVSDKEMDDIIFVLHDEMLHWLRSSLDFQFGESAITFLFTAPTIVSIPVLSIYEDRNRESDSTLIKRGDAVENDSIVVLNDKCHI